jgi:plasmid maintenance system antidote protein VapI
MSRKRPKLSGLRELVRLEVKRVIESEGTMKVANTIKVSQPYISKLKNQSIGLSLEFVDKLVDAFGYNVEFRMSRETDKAETRSIAVDAAEIEATARSILTLHEAGELTEKELREKIAIMKTATRQLELHNQPVGATT